MVEISFSNLELKYETYPKLKYLIKICVQSGKKQRSYVLIFQKVPVTYFLSIWLFHCLFVNTFNNDIRDLVAFIHVTRSSFLPVLHQWLQHVTVLVMSDSVLLFIQSVIVHSLQFHRFSFNTTVSSVVQPVPFRSNVLFKFKLFYWLLKLADRHI